MKEYLLFQAYGLQEVIDECKFALLRLLTVYSPATCPPVVIYTDQPDAFALFNPGITLHIRLIQADDITRWKGSNRFVHRVKIEVIKDCLQRYPGKLVYMDTDTYCLQPLDEVFQKIAPAFVFFHEDEGTIRPAHNLHFQKWKNFLLSGTAQALLPEKALDTHMWNAGCIGLDSSHLPLLDEVLEWTDKLYPLFPRHTVEQFSFCYVFQQQGITIAPAGSYVFHYWNLKEFRKVLNVFFTSGRYNSLPEWAAQSLQLDPRQIIAEKESYEHSSFFSRLLKKLRGRHWRIEQYI
jgi:hypothetical protein